jgi:hypothetical protein
MIRTMVVYPSRGFFLLEIKKIIYVYNIIKEVDTNEMSEKQKYENTV